MKPNKYIYLILLLILLMPAKVKAGWQFVAPMPHGRYGHDATLGPDGKIYVMGGLTSIKTNDGRYSNLVYDIRRDFWEYLMPAPGWIVTRYTVTFNAETNKWQWIKKGSGEKITGMTRNTNLERQGNGVALVTGKDGRIYWIGGKGNWMGYGENIVLPYNPENHTWPEVGHTRVYYSSFAYGDKTVYKTEIPPMSDRRIDHEAVVTSNGKIYVFGGRQKERIEDSHGNVSGNKLFVLDSVECYDPASNKWEYKKPMTSTRIVFAAAVGPDDKIYVFGGATGLYGNSATKILDTTEVYDPQTDTWSSRAPMPAPRDNHAAVLGADGKFYILGGSEGPDLPPLKDVFIYDPAKDTWQKGPAMNKPRAALAAVATPDGKIYAIGGTDKGAYKIKDKINQFLPRKKRLYAGKIQDTVEVLDIFK